VAASAAAGSVEKKNERACLVARTVPT